MDASHGMQLSKIKSPDFTLWQPVQMKKTVSSPEPALAEPRHAPTLILKQIPLDAHDENVALIHRSCTQFRPEEYRSFQKAKIANASGHHILATVMICDDASWLGPDEIGLTEKAFTRLGLNEGDATFVTPAEPPRSLEAVHSKIRGHTLSDFEIGGIVRDIAAHRYSDMEISAFLIACASFMTTEELLSLTTSMADAGNKLDWSSEIVLDKHCIGGVPGNRTSMIVVPIIAAHGMLIPKTSSRSITSPAGTADTMGVLSNVDLSWSQMRRVVEECNGCLAWGGHVNLSPADDILISVERRLNIDTREQMVASIISKKLAAGSTHLLIDIPVGPSTKVSNHTSAMRLRKLFEFVGDQVGLHLDVAITETSQPIGNGIGPVLEARDVMAVLRLEQHGPADLREKSLQLAGQLLENDPKLRGGLGYERARQLLDTGAALAKMKQIMKAQGPVANAPKLGDLSLDVRADKDGVVREIDCYRMSRLARYAGAPTDQGAGVDLLKKIGDQVRQGEPIYRIISCIEPSFRLATRLANENHGYRIGT